MVDSPNLLVTHLESNQDHPEDVVDAAIDAFDAAITALVAYPITVTNALALSQAQMAAQFTIQLTAGGITAAAVVTVAAFPRGLFCVDNQSGFNVTVTIAGQPGPVPYVKAGTAKWLRSDGVNVSEVIDPTFTVATLPPAAVRGRRAFVSDALAPAFAAAVVGGGAVVAPVYDTGAAWFAG